MRYLVTGGAGFIGSNFIRHVLNKERNAEIVNLDKLTYAGNIDNLKDIEGSFPESYKFIHGDICDAKLVDNLMKDSDIVVHFAAETHVDRSIMDAGDFIKTDVMGTFVLLNAARNFNIKKFIHISTDEVYGSIEKGSFNEESTLNPSNPYSAAKAGADRLAFSYFKTYNVPVIITRSSNNFGPYQHPEKFIPLFITNAMEDKKMPLYGDGKNKRDWLYVQDNCEAINFLIGGGKIGETYNIAAGNEYANIEIAKSILSNLGKKDSMIEYVKDRLSHDRRYSIEISKIKKLGWTPRFRFKDALSETVNWYQNNHWWWNKIKKGSFKEYYKAQYEKR